MTMKGLAQRLGLFGTSKPRESEPMETEPLEDFDPNRHTDQVSGIIEDVQEDRAIAENDIHPEGDGVTQIIEEYMEEEQIQEEIENFETPTYEEFIEEQAVTSTKFRNDVHPENVLGLAGELTDYVEPTKEALNFDLDGISNVYRERESELESHIEDSSSPEYVDQFSGGIHTLAEAEVGLALGIAVAETEEQNSVNASVDYEQIQEEVSGGYYMAQNIEKGRSVQSEAYEREDEKLHGEVEMIQGVPESLSEYTETSN